MYKLARERIFGSSEESVQGMTSETCHLKCVSTNAF